MRWSKSQQALLALAAEPVRGAPLDICYVEHDYSGVTTAARFAASRSAADKSLPLSLVINGATAWDAACQLSKLTRTSGGSYLDRVWNALFALRAAAHTAPARPIILWVDEAKLMRPARRELFVVTVEHCAAALHLSVRTVLLIGKVSVWKQAHEVWNGRELTQGMRVRDFPAISDRLWNGRAGERRGHALLFTDAGMKELRSGLLPGVEAEETRAVASA